MNWAITLANYQVQREKGEEKEGESGTLGKDKRSRGENVHVCVLAKKRKNMSTSSAKLFHRTHPQMLLATCRLSQGCFSNDMPCRLWVVRIFPVKKIPSNMDAQLQRNQHHSEQTNKYKTYVKAG